MNLNLHDLWRYALEILILTVGIYYVFRFMRGTRGAPVVTGFMVVLLTSVMVTYLLQHAVVAMDVPFLANARGKLNSKKITCFCHLRIVIHVLVHKTVILRRRRRVPLSEDENSQCNYGQHHYANSYCVKI